MGIVKRDIDLRGQDYHWSKRIRKSPLYHLGLIIIVLSTPLFLLFLANKTILNMESEIEALNLEHKMLLVQTDPLKLMEEEIAHINNLTDLEKDINSRSVPLSFNIREVLSEAATSLTIEKINIYTPDIMEIEGLSAGMKDAALYRDYIATLAYTRDAELVSIKSVDKNNFFFMIKAFIVKEKSENE